MKKILKIVGYVFLIIILLLIAGSIYDAKYSPKAREGIKNVSNLQAVNIGMSKKDVISIMGQPYKIINANNKESYEYISNDESYPYINFVFDENEKIIEINPPNKFNFK